MSADAMTINLVSMNASDTRAVAEWLVDGARSAAQPQQVMAQLCDRLLCCGIPLWRAAVSVSALHPQIVARRFIWRPGAEVEVSEGRFGLFDTPEFRDSPVAHVIGPARRFGAAWRTRRVRWIFRSCWNGAPKVRPTTWRRRSSSPTALFIW